VLFSAVRPVFALGSVCLAGRATRDPSLTHFTQTTAKFIRVQAKPLENSQDDPVPGNAAR
jgi:hypothetical protein